MLNIFKIGLWVVIVVSFVGCASRPSPSISKLQAATANSTGESITPEQLTITGYSYDGMSKVERWEAYTGNAYSCFGDGEDDADLHKRVMCIKKPTQE
jgi:hypothetical protein